MKSEYQRFKMGVGDYWEEKISDKENRISVIYRKNGDNHCRRREKIYEYPFKIRL